MDKPCHQWEELTQVLKAGRDSMGKVRGFRLWQATSPTLPTQTQHRGHQAKLP